MGEGSGGLIDGGGRGGEESDGGMRWKVSTLQCPPYSCRTPVIPAESGGIRWSPVEWDRNPVDSTGFCRIPLE